ncbi:MAG: hypothetical protein HY673_13145 [Chloroflexi bacterium]|nr:hypothetical protein [Chloroflexota bacterium]
MNLLTPSEFSREMPIWHSKYTETRYKTYPDLERELSEKAIHVGFLEKNDLARIAEWGGNQHGVKRRMMESNREEVVRDATQKAIHNLADPLKALQSLLPIYGWGLTYSSKTLRFIRPQDYPALDRHLQNNVTRSYTRLISICREVQETTSARGPRPDNRWWIADIEMALFMFIKSGGKLRLG